ncbi:hypothetical protein [Phaffia rhodozyma]|uniref:Uncharacterized protein n=1 Tax=Phaffia rhodozyma TaxID=264483 RepID=A0A0F7SH81_PHARH|nr:hypothetical protein [Phaffia rhodozyma]
MGIRFIVSIVVFSFLGYIACCVFTLASFFTTCLLLSFFVISGLQSLPVRFCSSYIRGLCVYVSARFLLLLIGYPRSLVFFFLLCSLMPMREGNTF